MEHLTIRWNNLNPRGRYRVTGCKEECRRSFLSLQLKVRYNLKLPKQDYGQRKDTFCTSQQ